MHRLASYGLLTSLAFGTAAFGQAPGDAGFLRTYAQTRGFMLGRPTQPRVTPDGKAVLFLRAAARGEARPVRVRRRHRQDA